MFEHRQLISANPAALVLLVTRIIELKCHEPIVVQELQTEAWVTAIAEIIRPLDQHDFYTSELAQYAEVAGGPLQALIGDRDNRELAEVLRQIQGQSFGGAYILRADSGRHGVIWMVVFE
jgi:hypothetical protein